MLLNSKGIAIRNLKAKNLYSVQLHIGRNYFWTNPIPADDSHEAMIIAENENPRAIGTGKVSKGSYL